MIQKYLSCYAIYCVPISCIQRWARRHLCRYLKSALFVFLFLAFGYLINDYCDRESDKKAGKDKVIFNLSERTIRISFILVIAGAILPVWIYSGFSLAVIGAEAVTFVMGASYSMPLFRFKEKGVWGLIVSSFAQRCMPLLVICQMVQKIKDCCSYFWYCPSSSGFDIFLSIKSSIWKMTGSPG